jgi:hypothetical protein
MYSVVGVLDIFRPSAVTSVAMAETTSAPERGARQRFSVIGEDLATWTALVNGEPITGRISRAEALSVPAVLRCRNLICSTSALLPIAATNSAGERIPTQLLDQPESVLGYTRSTTIAFTLEDILMEGVALWTIVLRSSSGFPTAVERVPHGRWHQDAETRTVYVNGREARPEDIIMFHGPNPPILTAGARAIRSLLALESTAAMYADSPEPTTYFRGADGIDPSEEDILSVLVAWRDARRKRATAYVPSAYSVEKADRMTPEELTLNESRSFAITEIARLCGCDPEDLGVSTTSRTYQNSVDRRKAMIDFTLGPYLRCLEERLSLNDVVPRGQQVRFVLDGWLRSATKERYEAHKIGLEAGFLTLAEVREMEDRPPLTGAESDSEDA